MKTKFVLGWATLAQICRTPCRLLRHQWICDEWICLYCHFYYLFFLSLHLFVWFHLFSLKRVNWAKQTPVFHFPIACYLLVLTCWSLPVGPYLLVLTCWSLPMLNCGMPCHSIDWGLGDQAGREGNIKESITRYLIFPTDVTVKVSTVLTRQRKLIAAILSVTFRWQFSRSTSNYPDEKVMKTKKKFQFFSSNCF